MKDYLAKAWAWVEKVETNPTVTKVEIAVLGIVVADFLKYNSNSALVTLLQQIVSTAWPVVEPLLTK